MGAGGGQRRSVVHGLSPRPVGHVPVRRTRPQIHRTVRSIRMSDGPAKALGVGDLPGSRFERHEPRSLATMDSHFHPGTKRSNHARGQRTPSGSRSGCHHRATGKDGKEVLQGKEIDGTTQRRNQEVRKKARSLCIAYHGSLDSVFWDWAGGRNQARTKSEHLERGGDR